MNDNTRVDLLATEVFRNQNNLKRLVIKIRQYAKNTQSNGPEEVLKSLSKSKNIKTIRTVNRLQSKKSQNLLILRDFLDEIPEGLSNYINSKNLFLGPNIDFLLDRNLKMLRMFPNAVLLVPSEWVIDVLQTNTILQKRTFKVWAAGVDENFWKNSQGLYHLRKNVLIYLKGIVERSEVERIISTLNLLGYSYELIEYGSYTNSFFKKILAKSSFAIWLGSTESQGIAQFQAWSMGVPTLIKQKDSYILDNVSYRASASPYLTPQTGCFTKSSEVKAEDIEQFVQSLHSRTPRAWIETNATTEIALQQLVNLFTRQKFASSSQDENK